RSQIAAIAHGAHASSALTGKNRTNLQALHANTLKLRRDLFINQLIRFDDLFFLVHWVSDGFTTYATDNALAKIHYFLVALVNRAHQDAIYSNAALFVYDRVLSGI